MMYNFPFYPPFPHRRYSYYPHNNTVGSVPFSNSSSQKAKNNYSNHHNNNSNNKTYEPTGLKETSEDNENIFEIFGLKLHSDDILLICLIFFLFKEGVQDEYLFIALILLLLS